jgi:hypothetical protein
MIYIAIYCYMQFSVVYIWYVMSFDYPGKMVKLTSCRLTKSNIDIILSPEIEG